MIYYYTLNMGPFTEIYIYIFIYGIIIGKNLQIIIKIL